MNKVTNAVGELCDRVSAGDPEAERQFQNQYTPLLKFLMRRLQSSQAAGAAAAFSAAGNPPRSTQDDPLGQSAGEGMARQICRRTIGELQAAGRGARHDTVGGRGAWLTARFG